MSRVRDRWPSFVRAAFAAGLCAVATATACSLTTSLSGYAGGAEAADAATGDGGGTRDGATDLDGGADADTRRFCERFAPEAGAVVYCNDFDDGRTVAASFDIMDVDDGGTVELDTTERVSPPASLRTRLARGALSCDYARPIEILPTPTPRMRYELDVRLGGADVDPAKHVLFLGIILKGGPTPCNLLLFGNGAETKFFEQYGAGAGGEDITPLEKALPFGAWANLRVDVDRNALTAKVYVDGVLAHTEPLDPGSCTDADTVELQPGIYCEDTATAPKEVRFDNIVVTALP